VLAILHKDLQLVWRTFRNYIVVGLAVIVIGAALFYFWGSHTSAKQALEGHQRNVLGIDVSSVPAATTATLKQSGHFKVVEYASMDDALTAKGEEEVDYALTAGDLELTLHLPSYTDLSLLVKAQAMDVSFSDVDQPLTFKTDNKANPDRFGTMLLWFGFVALLMLGNSLCNILVWEERAKGNLEELVASPATKVQIIVAKLSSVLLSTAGVCFGLMALLILLGLISVTIVVLRTESLMAMVQDLLSVSPEGVVSTAQASTPSVMDVAGAVLSWVNITNGTLMTGTVFFGLLTLTTLLIAINFLVKEQATLRFVITPLVLLIYGIPWVVKFPVAAELSFYWAIPVVNVYFTSAVESLAEPSATFWLPAMLTNAIAFLGALGVSVYMVGRMEDWPSR